MDTVMIERGHRNWSHHRREHEHRHQPQEHGGGGHSGRISFYGGSTDSKWEGRRTASGRAFHGGENTIAVRPSDIASGKYHFGEHVKVCANGRCVPATVTDTGGFGKYNRIADVSHAIADQLHFTHSGTVHARIVKD
jgi:rare lipoprotein A (peptidoglycan hydrolase)